MTDTTTAVATLEGAVADLNESRAGLISAINEVRAGAKQEGTVSDAVDIAITGTVIAVEQAVLTGGVATIAGLNEELGKSWAEKVNS